MIESGDTQAPPSSQEVINEVNVLDELCVQKYNPFITLAYHGIQGHWRQLCVQGEITLSSVHGLFPGVCKLYCALILCVCFVWYCVHYTMTIFKHVTLSLFPLRCGNSNYVLIYPVLWLYHTRYHLESDSWAIAILVSFCTFFRLTRIHYLFS